ncbi:MAG: hypothetical protein WBX19_03345 [Terracidiphilus sp.]
MPDKTSLAISACENAAKQYEDYFRTFTSIDSKGQATATISALVLAAAAAFLKDEHVATLIRAGLWTLLVVVMPPVLSLISLIVALIGSKVTEAVIPFDSPEQIREARDLTELSNDEFTDEHVLKYYLGRLEHWIGAINSIDGVVRKKANWVLAAQLIMILALLSLLLLYFVILATK